MVKGGYPLPNFPITQDTLCLQITIPNDDRIKLAVYGQLVELTKWWNWQKDGTENAKITADEMLKYFPFLVEENCVIDCNEVENCISSSPTIITIQGNVTTNTTSITNNAEDIQSIVDNPTNGNTYPPEPTIAEPDKLCNASLRVATELSNFISDTIDDAQTLTLQEFLETLLNFGGWQGELLNQFWDLIISNYAIDPNLATNCATAIPTIQEHLYCAEFNMTTAKSAIDADATLSAQVQASFIGAIDSITSDQLKKWIFIGSTETGANCINFCNEGLPAGIVIIDFVGDYVPTGAEAQIITGHDNWAVTAGAWSGEGFLTDDYSYMQANNTVIRGTITHWDVYARKNSDQAGNRIYLYVDGTSSTARIDATDNNFRWYSQTPFASGGAPTEITSSMFISGSRVLGSFNNYAGIKYIKLWTV